MSITIKLKGIETFERDLVTFRERALPFAIRNGLNDAAFATRKQWAKTELEKAFVLRNNFTERSIRVDRAQGLSLDSMESRVGSALAYLRAHEDGFTEQKKGKHGVAIPSSGAAGQGKKRIPRTKLVRQKHYMAAIAMRNRTRAATRSQRNWLAILQALDGGGFAFLESHGGKRGIYRVTGGKRGTRIRMIYDLSRPTTRTREHPTLEPALAAIDSQLVEIQRGALVRELRRTGILGY